MKLQALFLGVLAVVCSSSCVQAATLRVLVLDGQSGKPVPGRTVEIYSDKPASEPVVKGLTDQKGIFSTTSQLPKQIAVHVKGRYLCTGKNHGTSVQRLDDILSTGVVDSNSCGRKVSPPPEPGELILFVRHESLAEFLDMN